MENNYLTKNESVKARLSSGKLFHAYIISGPEGSGKHAMADFIANIAVCSETGDKKPCLICPNCKKASSGIHPDIINIRREEDKREHAISDIREMRSDASVIPNDADKKVYIVHDADHLNIPSQNAILKLLEEPPAHAVFILIAQNSGVLLETVRSRCIEISLTPEKEIQMPEESESLARTFLELVLSGNKMQLVEFLFPLEKSLGKNELLDFAAATKQLVAQTIRNNSKNNTDNSLATLIAVSDTFDKVIKNIDFNVGTGHNIGLIMSRFL